MKKYLIVFVVGSIGMLKAQTSTSVKLSLKQAIESAESNNIDVRKSSTDVMMAMETVKQTAAIGLPQISASAGYNQFLTIPGQYVKNFSGPSPEYIKLTFAQKISSTVGISANQLIFDGSYLVALKATKDFLNLSTLLDAKTKNDVQFNVAKAYLMVATTEKNISVVDANIAVLEKSLKDLKEVNKEGFAEKLDVQRLSLALGNLTIQKEKLSNAVSLLKNVLKLQMGMDVNTNIDLTDNIEQINEQIKMSDVEKTKFDSKLRIEYQILDQSIRLGNLDKKRYQMGYLPRLVGFYQLQGTTNRPEFNFFQSNLPINNSWVPSQLIGLQLQLSIFDGFAGASKIRETQLKINKAKMDLENFNNAANMQFNNAQKSYETQLKQAEIQKENLDLAKQIFETATSKYNEGVGSSLEVMQADTDLKTSQSNYLSAIYDLVMAKIDYYQSTGKTIK